MSDLRISDLAIKSPLSGDFLSGITPPFATVGSNRRFAVTDWLIRAGIPGGQTATGGTVAGDDLVLAGSAAAGGGRVHSDAPFELLYSEGNTTPAEQISLRWRPTFTTAGAYIGGMIENSATITYTNSFYIYASLLDRSTHISNAPAGFQAFTLFNALPTIRQGTNSALVQMLILNDGGLHERTTAGTSTSPQHITVSSVPHIAARIAGATMTWTTGASGLSFAPKFTTVAGSIINMGTLVAVDQTAPGVALFSTQGGTENITNIYGHRFRAHTNVVSGEINVIRNEMAPAANRYLIRSTAALQSNFGAGSLFNCGFVQILSDVSSLSLGAAGGDMQISWNGSNETHNPATGTTWHIDTNTADETIFFGDGTIHTGSFNFDRFQFGQSGAIGNAVGVFAAPTRTTGVPGGWTDFNLTQAGNLTIDDAMSQVFAWNINQISLTIGTGSVAGADVAAFNVGGMTTSGVTGAFTSALRSTGRFLQRGMVRYDPIAPANLTGTVNAWAGLLTGSQNNSGRYWARITCDAATTLNGIDSTAAYDGDTYEVTNVGANALTVANQAGAAAAADRIILGAFGGTLGVDETIVFRYDSTTARWRVTGD